MPRLNIALLGPPNIDRDGAPLEVDTRKAIALLAYAAVEGGTHSRDRLAALFWPDVDQSRAHAALRRTLSTLNKALDGPWLDIDRESVAFVRAPDTTLDVDTFHAKLAATSAHGHPAGQACPQCVPLLVEAAALYRDDFMAGFTLRDSPGFDDWQFFQAESLRREFAAALERLVAGLSARGDFERAIEYGRRWLALDPLHEPAHRQLMLLYAWSNQRGAALRQYRDCVRVLEQELGVAPLPETNELYEALKENRQPPPPNQQPARAPAPAADATPPAAPPAPAALPLVGRTAEWNTLLAGYTSIATEGRLLVLEGEAGIGKTRLAEALLHHARSLGAAVVAARCYEGELNLAYGPFVEGLRAALASAGAEPPAWLAGVATHWLSEAARLLPELLNTRPGVPAPAPLDRPGAQGRFLEGVRQLLVAALGSGARPGILLIDDAHWMDEASLDLLTYLVRRLRDHPAALLLTWRGEQLPPNHRLRTLLAEAGRAGHAVSVSLERLSLNDVAQLVSAAGPAQPEDRDFIERFYKETEGLPFFVVEYLNSLAQAAERGDAPAWALPGGVRNLLLTRLRGVDDAALQLLHAAAVIGRSFDLDTLHAASGRSDEETVSGLEALMAAGLVTEVDGDNAAAPAYDFSHEKLRTLVYEETSLARRRLLHRRVAEALAARTRRPNGPQAGALASQIAQHYQAAGRDAEAADYFRQAGEHARAVFANAEALAHFRSALALGHPDAAALHEAIGDLHTLSGAYDAAIAAYETAAALTGEQQRSSPEANAMALAGLERKLGNVYHRRGEWEQAESHFKSALNALGAELVSDAAEPGSAADSLQHDHAPGLQARVYADWSLTAHQRGNALAHELAQRALALAEAAGDDRALAQAHNILGILASSAGQQEEAQRHLSTSLSLAEALNEPAARAAALNNLALAYSRSGQYAEALRFTEQALALCAAQGDRHREAALHSNLADLLHATGQAEAAMRHLKQSVTIYAEIGAQATSLQPEIWKLAEW